jgi:cell division protein FtsL
MDSVKHFFDLLDYTTFRVFLYVLMVVGAIALIKRTHGSRDA